jgi:hypothetical protein
VHSLFFGLGWELDLGIRGESKTLKRAEGVFEKTRRPSRDFIAYAWSQATGNPQARSEAASLVSGEKEDSNEPLKML